MPLFALKTSANREDHVADFLATNIKKKNFPVYAILVGHGMRGYIFLEAETIKAAQEASDGIPYAKGILKREVPIKEISPMLEQVKTTQVNILKNDIVEIISGPFKREKAKVTRIDQQKEEVVVELLETAASIPITLKIDNVKVIRREGAEDKGEE